jgi:MFS family permease
MSVGMIGLVFSINPVGAFLFSFFMGSRMGEWGRKRCLIAGLVINYEEEKIIRSCKFLR